LLRAEPPVRGCANAGQQPLFILTQANAPMAQPTAASSTLATISIGGSDAGALSAIQPNTNAAAHPMVNMIEQVFIMARIPP
jgi:hypothetical protein